MLKKIKDINLKIDNYKLGFTSIALEGTAIVLPISLYASTALYNPESNINMLMNYAFLYFSASLIQLEANHYKDSNKDFYNFLDKLSTKIIYVATLNCIEPILKEILKDYCDPTLLSALSYVGTRIIYSNFNYEKNILNDKYDSTRCESTFKSAVPAILSKVSEIFISKNEGVKCFVYSVGKSCIDTLVQDHFEIKDFWKNISSKNFFKFSFYASEYFMVKSCGLFNGISSLENNTIISTISSSIYRVGYENEIEFYSKYAAERLLNVSKDSREANMHIR